MEFGSQVKRLFYTEDNFRRRIREIKNKPAKVTPIYFFIPEFNGFLPWTGLEYVKLFIKVTRLIKSCFNYQCLSVSEGLCLSVCYY